MALGVTPIIVIKNGAAEAPAAPLRTSPCTHHATLGRSTWRRASQAQYSSVFKLPNRRPPGELPIMRTPTTATTTQQQQQQAKYFFKK